MTMDVDPPAKSKEESTVSVHPLAIVNMSDQYTRISCGGSPLPRDAPVVGLLFGRYSDACLQIVDADDIPTDRSDAAALQVSLHHAVFPQNQVVGWYRVGADAEPTQQDLQLTQELKQHYCSSDQSDRRFVFSLLQVQQQRDKSMTDADEKAEEDEPLPLNLYQVQTVDGGNTILVGIEHWTLETSHPERIAVERVVREQPQHDLKQGAGEQAASKDDGDANNNSNNNQQEVSQTLPPQRSTYNNYMSSVQQSLQAMSERVKVLMDYLERTGRGELPPNPRLMRHVQGLILQLGPLAKSAPHDDDENNGGDDAILLSHLSAVAKTVQAVHGYTEKFRTMHDNRPVAGTSAREGRRGGLFRDM